MPVLEVSIKADYQLVASGCLVIVWICWPGPKACGTSPTGQYLLIVQLKYRLHHGVGFFFKQTEHIYRCRKGLEQISCLKEQAIQ
jgi:hypothetical protein